MPTLNQYKMEEPNKNKAEVKENLKESEDAAIEETEEIDELAVDIPDIPLPSFEHEESSIIEDEFDSAYKFAVAGVGQGGSRLAETFWKLGYRRVVAINTAAQDLKPISLPEKNKLLLGGSGAGKNRKKAQAIFEEHKEDILDFLKNSFGTGIDRILVCIGAGGGTGAGGGPIVVDVCHDLCQSCGIEQSDHDAKVGAVLALPTKSEGSRVKTNAKETAETLIKSSASGTLSPLIILDNERIRHLYPKLSVNKFWNTANTSICSLFHLFNKIAAQDSEYTAFDKADLDTVMSSGIISFGAVPVKYTGELVEETDISHAVRDNLKKNILANIDVNTGNVAACVVIGDKDTLDHTPQESLEHGFEQLTRLLGEGSTVHRGIYHTSKKGLVVYTIIGGIEAPEQLLS
jgi:cell division GTPase FtsZ|tara:strand:- start:17338 stop:18549 length:1212 start_codon:yes stop_codon:yes gene_type:complete